MWDCLNIRTNAVIDVVLSEIADPMPPEPVSLVAMKQYLKMENISADDSVITDMIKEARRWVERRCGISIVSKGVTAIVEVMNSLELPYGPIDKDSITVLDNNGETVSTPRLVGLDGSFICLEGFGRFEVSYEAGYAEVPQELLQAIKAHVAFSYENRGDELDKSNKPYAMEAKAKSNLYRRTIGF